MRRYEVAVFNDAYDLNELLPFLLLALPLLLLVRRCKRACSAHKHVARKHWGGGRDSSRDAEAGSLSQITITKAD